LNIPTWKSRRLPPLVSAYPRRSKIHPDPSQGLASVEALFVATLILGEPRHDLIERYRWREAFLAANRRQLEPLLARSSSPPAPPIPY
jgi:pre-rRNA-processing protein TSR3